MLTKSGAKLLDFGLAKLGSVAPIGIAGMTTAATRSEPLTGQGTILGTVQDMAPEQLEGKDADARTDIFAFGVVIYEMVTGRKAFDEKSQASLIGAILKDNPPPMVASQPLVLGGARSRRPDLPRQGPRRPMAERKRSAAASCNGSPKARPKEQAAAIVPSTRFRERAVVGRGCGCGPGDSGARSPRHTLFPPRSARAGRHAPGCRHAAHERCLFVCALAGRTAVGVCRQWRERAHSSGCGRSTRSRRSRSQGLRARPFPSGRRMAARWAFLPTAN